ncbi:uncharacterized protein EV422DRAFT_568749 [Fimicolochytrium jonesii]|uniref:uncharacterized protein n=1 Tax=Fimicolochytrium jonesii TaxID=1396493 RepID=UPI0022FF3783|nr:uncharacterized protein EV422DRAFT_568749 [Fimicolochytrium jonesii]KAI8819317.1 hypothetical protein EV422DRAFT_568749 [Fimicolochytrium jonesii]
MSKRNYAAMESEISPYKAFSMPPLDADLKRSVGPHSKETVAYFFHEEAGSYHYGEGHPMKPARLSLTHNLVVSYGLEKKMLNFRARNASEEEIKYFHSADYVEFLRRVTPDNFYMYEQCLRRYNVGVEDCPVFDGLWDFCSMYSGASIDAARKLVAGTADIAVNWSGGLHHAKKWEASGFCYVNDIVLGICELLREFPRVLYVDIDVHHGDGVQEAFYRSNRVMTVSFHRYDGHFFPGTGSIEEKGCAAGRNYAVNVPLTEFINDESYAYIFRSVMTDVMTMFRPGAVVLQCGADSLASDRLGSFNLSIRGHGECVKFMKSFKVPMLVLGGGGYTIRNVARAWTYETSVLTDTDLENELPGNLYMSYYGPDYQLHAPIVDPNAEDTNTRQKLDGIREKVREYLREIEHAPSVQMDVIPPGLDKLYDVDGRQADDAEDTYADVRDYSGIFADTSRNKQKHTADERDYYDGDRDHDRDGDDSGDEDLEI